MPAEPSERRVVALVGAVQLINILDFMVPMPLGPDFARALDIPASQLGVVGGAYTASAAVAGLVASRFVDRLERRLALVVALVGLAFSTLLCAFATSFATLLAARVLAGLFGGPCSSVGLAIVSDVVPPERRGRAMGALMGAFSVASVLGVPAALKVAELGSWRTPFVGVAALGLLTAALTRLSLPTFSSHLDRASERTEASSTLSRRALLAFAATCVANTAMFMVTPNISAHVQRNLHYPREQLGTLYMAGGTAAFFTMRLAGRLVDRVGASAAALAATLGFVLTLFVGFVSPTPRVPVVVVFVLFMVASSTRNVAITAISTRVPAPHERGRFMSLLSVVQHLAAASGAFFSSRLLTDDGDHVVGMPLLATIAGALSLAVPLLVHRVEREVAAPSS